MAGNEVIVDLHIEKIHDNSASLDNSQKLDYQLRYFEKCMDEAIINNIKFLIVIHGIGKGVLKNAIHDSLRQNDAVHSFVNEYNPKFGFGSTEIVFN